MSNSSNFYFTLAIVVATICGPVFAVQAQKVLERRRAISDRRRQIYKTLMATRATSLSGIHVEALNAVPVEFYSAGNEKLKKIEDQWHAYMDWLNTPAASTPDWAEKKRDKLVDMLYEMSIYLGYKFNKTEIKNDVYYPLGHHNIESEQAVIRAGMVKLLNGESPLPLTIKDFPSNDDVNKENQQIRQLLIQWLMQQNRDPPHYSKSS